MLCSAALLCLVPDLIPGPLLVEGHQRTKALFLINIYSSPWSRGVQSWPLRVGSPLVYPTVQDSLLGYTVAALRAAIGVFAR